MYDDCLYKLYGWAGNYPYVMIIDHIGWWWILLCSAATGTTVNKLNT